MKHESANPVCLALIMMLALLMAFTIPATAQTRADLEMQYRTWLEEKIWPRAGAKGVERQTFVTAFDGITLNWALPDLVIPGAAPAQDTAQLQAEFGAPSRYFSANALAGATTVGRQMARQHADTLARVEAQTGVPGHIILGIWGRESAYGRAAIPHDAFDVLGTLGFLSSRASYFTDELIAALQVAQAGHAGNGPLRSSWAGALGQPQFMPSNVLKYAVDGNGDGRADIWGSEADTIASIGNYLARHGWVAARDWGFEVHVPEAVSCALEGPDQGRPISEWEAMGIARVSGQPFPDHERREEGFLLMPAGRFGPTFIVTPNFYVLKEYNMSDLYALFVGHVGDRIAFGMGDFRAPWQPVDQLYRSDIAVMQEGLVALGHDVGGVDGLPGFKTRRSIGKWQMSTGQPPSCFPSAGMAALLRQ